MKINQQAHDKLINYSWPGNIRELANAIERAVILTGDQKTISAETLSFLKPSLPSENGHSHFRLPPEGILLEEMEKDLARQAIEASGNNQTLAAKLLGLTRAKFRVLMKQIEK
jgi:transcriptional regulator with PAS, ATPase and Fis domain